MTWKEQAVVIPGPGGLTLEGVAQKVGGPAVEREEGSLVELAPGPGGELRPESSRAGDPRAALLAAAHPLFGGSLDHPVLSELAYALYRAGVASLRFNWRGVGASHGAVTGALEAAEEDWAAALDHMCADAAPPVIGGGYSFGAATALRSALRDRRIARLLLVAPPLRMLESLDLGALAIPLRVLVGEHDGFCAPGELSERLREARDARLEVIPDADHFFATRGLAEIGARARGLILA